MSESNSVYIAYRRGIAGLVARAVFQDLRANGIDAFMDVEQMNSEQAETIYLNQIIARPYFLLILTPGTLEPFAERGDWLRSQVEQAVKTKRVIIPLASPNFKAGDIRRLVSGSLGAELSRGKPVEYKYGAFTEAMNKIRIHALKAVDLPLTPTSAADQETVTRELESGSAAPTVSRDHLLAQAHFEQALTRKKDETDIRIKDYSEAIRLYPDFAEAYARRGANRDVQGDLEGALADCDAAIRLRPDFDVAYVNRGIVRAELDDISGAIADYTEAIRLNPQLAQAYYNRGQAYTEIDEQANAVNDFSEAIRLNPQSATYYYNRALARAELKDYAGAITDFDETIQRDSNFAEAYYNRGLAHAETDLHAAVADWTEAIRINPKFAQAYYNRGLVRANWADLEGTIEDMSNLLELMPDSPEAQRIKDRIEELRRLKGDEQHE